MTIRKTRLTAARLCVCLSAALSAWGADYVEACSFQHIGDFAVWASHAIHHCEIRNCRIEHTGHGAIPIQNHDVKRVEQPGVRGAFNRVYSIGFYLGNGKTRPHIAAATRGPGVWQHLVVNVARGSVMTLYDVPMHQIAVKAVRPAGAPEYGDVCFRYGWGREKFLTVDDAKQAIRAFHATRVDTKNEGRRSPQSIQRERQPEEAAANASRLTPRRRPQPETQNRSAELEIAIETRTRSR